MALFTRTLRWSLAETQVLLIGARKDLREFLANHTFSVNVLDWPSWGLGSRICDFAPDWVILGQSAGDPKLTLRHYH
jgi:hypothetical protein